MSTRWLSESLLCEHLGEVNSRALLQALGGMSFYVPKLAGGHTDIMGRDLSRILDPPAYRALTRLAGGAVVSLPSARRSRAANLARPRLLRGESPRRVAAALGLSQRYVEMLASRMRNDQARLPGL